MRQRAGQAMTLAHTLVADIDVSMSVRLCFNERKATQAAAHLLRLRGGRMSGTAGTLVAQGAQRHEAATTATNVPIRPRSSAGTRAVTLGT